MFQGKRRRAKEKKERKERRRLGDRSRRGVPKVEKDGG